MTDAGAIDNACYSHDLLLHESDEELIEGTRAFVEQALDSGGHVIVHSSPSRVAMLERALGYPARLEYGLDQDLYASPTKTLFAYQRKLAQSAEPLELWATGTVPLGANVKGHAAWRRYESLVNEVLSSYAFHGLCTYDMRSLPASTIAAARATHPCVSTGSGRTPSLEYQIPADFLNDPLAGVPTAPMRLPAMSMTLVGFQHLKHARHLVRESGVSSSALSRQTIESFVTAVNEVLVNSLAHTRRPVELALWVEPTRLVGRVVDDGPGMPDPLSGYRYPKPHGPKGLWVARQLCSDIFVSNLRGGGCSVLLVAE
jgi:anti-sigma regulatory factor (Ser/Thr protein kinase)